MIFLFGAGPILVLTVDKGVTSNPYKPRIHWMCFFRGLGESCEKQDAPLMHAQRFLKHVCHVFCFKHIKSDKIIVSFNQELAMEKKHNDSSKTRKILSSSSR